jgi:hypothetical protein
MAGSRRRTQGETDCYGKKEKQEEKIGIQFPEPVFYFKAENFSEHCGICWVMS